MGTFLLGVAASTPVPSGTHLPIPEVAAAGGLEHEDVIGVERGGSDGHLDGLGVVLIGAMHVEEAGGGCGLLAARPRGATLGNRDRRSPLVPQAQAPAQSPPQQPCTHRIHHHLALENGHQVGRLLAHGDADLHGLVVVLLVQDDGLVGGGGQLISAGLAALGRAEQGSAPTTAPFSLLGRGNPHAVPMGSCIGADHPQSGEMPLSPTCGQ